MGLRLDKIDAASAGVFAVTATITAGLYRQLPPRIATHFDVHGVPNGWMPREAGAWFGLGLGAVVWSLVRFAGHLTPPAKRARLEEAPLSALGLLLVGLLSAVQLLLLWVALTPGADLTRPLMFILGTFSVGLGLLLPRFPPNPLVGVRTYYTLTNEDAWEKTNKLAGTAFVISGCATLVATLVSAQLGVIVAVASMLLAALVASVYSIALGRRGSR